MLLRQAINALTLGSLNHGGLIAESPPAAIRSDPAVIAAYLGEGH